MAIDEYALSCDNEGNLVLSNWRTLQVWDALEKLIAVLGQDASLNRSLLYAWKEGHHRATAKEAYAWRGALDEIKGSDLSFKCGNLFDQDQVTLIADKPAMLKIAAEIANTLMHSYTNGHKINLSQRVSKVPSRFAL